MRVHDTMTREPVTVGPSTDVSAARGLLRRYAIRHLPVVDHGRLVGMVSDRDVRLSKAALHRVADRMASPARLALSESAGVGLVIETVMSAPVQVITADEPVDAAVGLMLRRRISALPVVDQGVLVGIITTTDCLLASLPPARAVSSGERSGPRPRPRALPSESWVG